MDSIKAAGTEANTIKLNSPAIAGTSLEPSLTLPTLKSTSSLILLRYRNLSALNTQCPGVDECEAFEELRHDRSDILGDISEMSGRVLKVASKGRILVECGLRLGEGLHCY